MIKKLIFTLVMTTGFMCQGMEQKANISKLAQEINKRRCPQGIQETFNESLQKHGMDHVFGRAYSIEELPSHIFKEEKDRLIGAKLYNEVIEKKQLNLLFVPDKCACSFNNNIWIAAKKVNNFSDKPLNLEQVKQLCTLVLKTWAWDFHAENIKPTVDGRVVIIDTKLIRFQNQKNERIRGLYRMLHGTRHPVPMTEQATQYLKKEIQREKYNIEIAEWLEQELIKEGAADILKTYQASRIRSYQEYWNGI